MLFREAAQVVILLLFVMLITIKVLKRDREVSSCGSYFDTQEQPHNFTSFISECNELVFGRKAITVKLDPKNVVNTIRTVFDEQYVEQVADIIAEKAAKRFVNEIIKNFEELDNNPIRSMKVDQEEGRGKNRKEMKIMDNEEALKLLKRPSPDGDNLDEHNKESLLLSKEQEDVKQKKKIPVIGLMKINGIYYRRDLGVL